MEERFQTLGEEIANAISHGIGALAALIGIPILISHCAKSGDLNTLISVFVFILTAFILYLTSTLYHSLPRNKAKPVFLILDNSAIFLLIAGTYTPFSLVVLKGSLGWLLFSLVWILACFGVTIKAIRLVKYPWISTTLYLAMGWLCLLVGKPLFTNLNSTSLTWLIAGGIAYTFGVVFFVLDEKVKYTHFIWHLFVLAGTVCHAVSIYFLV